MKIEQGDSNFLPGLRRFQRLSPGDLRDAVMRRKALICLVAMLVSLAIAFGALLLPNIYRATTVILVDPRKVPDAYVQSTVSSGVSERLTTLRQEILSTTRLSQIIDSMGLYKDLKHSRTQEQIIEQMRKDIEVEVVAGTPGDKGLDAFRISYRSRTAPEAAKVTNRLASLFIEENIRAREQMVIGTSEFIDRELASSKDELDKREAAIREVRQKNAEQLPESENSHLQALQGLQLELRSEIDAASRAQQQKVYLQTTLASTPPVVDLDKANGASPDLSGLESDLAEQQGQLDQLRARYGPQFPDVVKRQTEIDTLQRQIAEIRRTGRPTKKPKASKNPVIESQIALLDDEITRRTAHEQELKNQIAFHESQLSRIPVVQQQIAATQRDYEIARDHYKSLLDRKFSADMSSNLESYQKGERFVVLDPAQVPETPYQPNRPIIDGIGLVIGIVLGFFVAFAIEVFDATVWSEKDVFGPILGHIPMVVTDADRMAKRRCAVLAFAGNFVLVCIYAGVFFVSSR